MAGKIQSNPETASALATSLKTGTQSVLACDAATKDGDSTITGNVNNASPAIDRLSSHANSIATALNSFADCITKVDKNFQENNQQVAQAVQQLTTER